MTLQLVAHHFLCFQLLLKLSFLVPKLLFLESKFRLSIGQLHRQFFNQRLLRIELVLEVIYRSLSDSQILLDLCQSCLAVFLFLRELD